MYSIQEGSQVRLLEFVGLHLDQTLRLFAEFFTAIIIMGCVCVCVCVCVKMDQVFSLSYSKSENRTEKNSRGQKISKKKLRKKIALTLCKNNLSYHQNKIADVSYLIWRHFSYMQIMC